MSGIWHWLLQVTGSFAAGTRWNLFWSGFGSGPLAWCAIPFVYYVHHICHEHRCVRIGHPNQHGEVNCRRHVKVQPNTK